MIFYPITCHTSTFKLKKRKIKASVTILFKHTKYRFPANYFEASGLINSNFRSYFKPSS